MNVSDCLLCHDAKCAMACTKMKPDRILRALYFENEESVRNGFYGDIECGDCLAECEKACPVHLNIKEILSSIGMKEEKTEIEDSLLETDLCGIRLENPFLLSSSIVSSTYEMCARAFEAGWAGAAYKTICLMDIKESSPRFAAVKGNDARIIGFKNIEQLSDKSLKENLEVFARLKKNYPGKFLLVSVMGRDEKEWAYLAQVLDKSGADALELNFSCPNMTQEHTGSDVGQIPELVEKYTRIAKENTSLPVLAKLTPNVAHIEDSALAAIRGGADGVAAINTIKSLIEVDIDPYDGITEAAIGGYSGKAVHPIAKRFIAELAQEEEVAKTHISAMGGIETWKDALEFIALGADSVQVTTAVMLYGYRIIEDLKDGLALYLKEHGFSNIREMKRKALDGIVGTNELDRISVIYPKFLREKCVGCQRCYLSCLDGGHQAITMKDDKPILDPQKCVGCHLCLLVCPKEAIVSSDIKVTRKL